MLYDVSPIALRYQDCLRHLEFLTLLRFFPIGMIVPKFCCSIWILALAVALFVSSTEVPFILVQKLLISFADSDPTFDSQPTRVHQRFVVVSPSLGGSA